jgi:hypothetical protein
MSFQDQDHTMIFRSSLPSAAHTAGLFVSMSLLMSAGCDSNTISHSAQGSAQVAAAYSDMDINDQLNAMAQSPPEGMKVETFSLDFAPSARC